MRVPDPRYLTRYPRQGDVALLCEGDVAGFEVDLLEKWTIQHAGIFIDVWPCGTKSSFFGVSDAIGRSRPIAVLEDRDFRTADQATEKCDRLAQNRRDRDVEVKFWRAWRRNEIENYLIEPEVVAPVLTARFNVDGATVSQRLQDVISASSLDQAAQKAIYSFQSLVSGYHPDRYIFGLPRKTHRPLLQLKGVTAPSSDIVAAKLKEEFSAKKQLLAKDSQRLDERLSEILREFEANMKAWRNQSLNNRDWREDWAGKDLLSLLCRWLAVDPGWIGPSGKQEVIDWDSLGFKEAGRQEREILTMLQPDLVRSFLEFLYKNSNTEIFQEWDDLAKALR